MEEEEEEEGKCAFVGCTRRGGGGKGDKVTVLWRRYGIMRVGKRLFFSFPLLCANSLLEYGRAQSACTSREKKDKKCSYAQRSIAGLVL